MEGVISQSLLAVTGPAGTPAQETAHFCPPCGVKFRISSSAAVDVRLLVALLAEMLNI